MEKKAVILCVDDEKLVLDSLVNQLRNHFGSTYLYETAENSEEGHEVINDMIGQGHEIKLIISDWLMPVDRGDKFLIEVYGELPGTALIMLSGHADEAAVDRARTYANLHCFIRKPWEKDHLLAEVERALHGDAAENIVG
jgi:DNA-binding NtrC family response regulator